MTVMSTWAAVSLIVIALVNLGILGGLVYLVFMVRNQTQKKQEQAQPVSSEGPATLHTVQEVASDVSKRVETISERAEHLATDVTQRAERVAADVSQRVDNITVGTTQRFDMLTQDFSSRADHMMGLSERLANRLVERVDTTTAVIEEAIARPMIGLASLRAGLTRGLEAWRGYRSRLTEVQTREAREAEVRRMIEETTATPAAQAEAGD